MKRFSLFKKNQNNQLRAHASVMTMNPIVDLGSCLRGFCVETAIEEGIMYREVDLDWNMDDYWEGEEVQVRLSS